MIVAQTYATFGVFWGIGEREDFLKAFPINRIPISYKQGISITCHNSVYSIKSDSDFSTPTKQQVHKDVRLFVHRHRL